MGSERERTYLLRIAREVVGSLAGTGVTLGDLSIATVVGLEDGELPAGGVSQLDVELAVLAVVGGGEALAGLGDEAGVEESDGGQVGGQLAGDGASRAAGTGEGNAGDLDLIARGAGSEVVGGHLGQGRCQAEEGEERGELHFDESRWGSVSDRVGI